MMGVGLWIAAGFAAFALARLVPFARHGPAWIELVVAIPSALLAGAGATAMDFGGWAEPDPRAGVFAFLVATSTLALIRLIRLLRNKLKLRSG
jgi:CHASE2 domain-containing sensor protein